MNQFRKHNKPTYLDRLWNLTRLIIYKNFKKIFTLSLELIYIDTRKKYFTEK